MAMVGLGHSRSARFATSERLSDSFTSSGVERNSSNFEMSAPDTKALSPAPLSITTRTSGSVA
jgi:hypothetical protein